MSTDALILKKKIIINAPVKRQKKWEGILPEVHLSQGLQELSTDKPIGGVPQSKQVYHQLQAKLTQGAAAHRHDTVLKHT